MLRANQSSSKTTKKHPHKPSPSRRLTRTSRAFKTFSNYIQPGKLPKQRQKIKPHPRAFSTTMQSTLGDNNVHTMSTQGFGDSEQTSKQYDAVRPSYSPVVIQSILEPIYHAYSENPEASRRPMRILDLGCGTGIFTKLLALELYKVSEGCEAELYCVDPNTQMVNVFKKSLTVDGFRSSTSPIAHELKSMSDPAVQAIIDMIKIPYVASVDELPYSGGFFDGVVAAQAFHWFATPQALINIQRCLTPNGVFAFCWNYWVSTKPAPPSGPDPGDSAAPNDSVDMSGIPLGDRWMHRLSAIIEPLYVETATPHQKTVEFQKLFANTEQYGKKFGLSAPFAQLHSIYLDTRRDTTRWMVREMVHQRIDSISVVHTLPKERYQDFLKKVDSILDHSDTPTRINQETNQTEWPIGFWCEVHYAQNSKSVGTPIGDGFTSF